MDKVITRIINLPRHINALTVADADGDYNIYINAALSDIGRRRAFLHEVKHIRKNHFYTDKPVKRCEREAQ